MNKPIRCTTHFHACDCREYEFEQLRKDLQEKDEEIEALKTKRESLKYFWKTVMDKFSKKYPDAGSANTTALTALTEAFDIYCENERLQKENEKLQHQLEIQTKRVENLKRSNKFYANEENWTIDGHTHEEETYYVREHGEFGVTIRGDVDPSYRYGGKLARECQAIDQELEKELEKL